MVQLRLRTWGLGGRTLSRGDSRPNDFSVNLTEANSAFGCLESLLVPVEIQRSDEFYVTPTELRALVALVNAEFGRRIAAVGVAIEASSLYFNLHVKNRRDRV